MQTRRFTNKSVSSRPAFVLVSGALLAVLSGAAQAQTTRSHPEPSAPSHSTPSGGSSGAHTGHPSSSASSGSKSGTHSVTGGVGLGRSDSAAAHSGKVNYGALFPTQTRSIAKSVTSSATPNGTRLPGGFLPGFGVFPNLPVPLPPDDPDPTSDTDKNGKDDTGSSKSGTVTVSVRVGKPGGDGASAAKTGTTSAGVGKNVTDNLALDRFKASQEAEAAKAESNKSQIVWPDRDSSPFWAYSVDEVFWFPGEVGYGYPDGTVLFPTPGSVIVKGWPNYDAKAGVSRNEPERNYRIGEKKKPRRNVDIDPALKDIQRAFQESQPRLLASHLQREEPLAYNAPGEKRDLITAELLQEQLQTLFATRESITMEFDPPEQLESDLFAVTAWYLYRDLVSPTVYRAKIRLVLQAQDDRIILTAFEMD